MPKLLPKELREQAVQLRESGLSYAEISQQLQISKRWCSTNLKNVESKVRKKFKNLYDKSKTRTGVSKTEVAKELEIYELPEKEVSKQMKSAVRRIRSNNKENLVRPDWMLPESSMFITNRVVQTSMDIEDHCNEEAFFLYCTIKANTPKEKHNELPSVRKIKAAMLSLAMASVATGKDADSRLSSWLESLYRTANTLEQRNPCAMVAVQVSSEYQQDFSDLEDCMF